MHVIDSLAIGGKERILVDMVNACDPAKFSMSVCVTRSDASLCDEIQPNIPVKVLHRQHKWSRSGFIELQKFAQQQNIDLYHAHGRSTLSFLLAARQLRIIREPILFHDHFGDIEIDTQVPAWFRYWGSRHIDYYVGVCNELVDWAVGAGVSQMRASMIANALDIQRFAVLPALDLRQMFDIPIEQKIGIMVGNLRPVKGLDLLISACSKIPKNILPVFFIIGEVQDADYVQDCLSLIHKNGLEQHFHFVGRRLDSLSWMKGADFAVLPSRSESGPLVLIEFMACGLPFLSFAVGGISHTVKQYLPDGFAMPKDYYQFATKLENLIKMPYERMKEQGEVARKLSFELFNVQNRMPSWYAIYQQVINN